MSVHEYMINVYNFILIWIEEYPNSPLSNRFESVANSPLMDDWISFIENPNHPFNYAEVLRQLRFPNPFETRRRGQGIGSSKPKKPKPFDYSVPNDFPSIKDKLTSLYKFYKYDTEMGAKKMNEIFSSDDINAIKKFVNNPTIDNLGTMPLSYKDYIVRYNTYIKKVNDLQEAKDLARWRRRFK